MHTFSWKKSAWRRKVLLGLGGGLLAVLLWGIMSGWPFSLHLLRFYPKKLGSAFIGWVAERELPRSLRPRILGAFARKYGVAVAEAEKPIEDYPSLQAFFTRHLKTGLRPQEAPAPGFVNSPVDGRIIAEGAIEQGTVLQAKGLPYRVSELLKHIPEPGRFEGGRYLTLYLSPRDYHRIHVPIEGQVTAVAHVEGELWPVNDASTNHVPRLYERNRRATWVARGTGADEGLEVAAVCVGATHVGAVLIEERWLEGRPLPRDGGLSVNALPCAPGDGLGAFAFGSTVVLLVGGEKAKDWVPLQREGTVKVGQRLGIFR